MKERFKFDPRTSQFQSANWFQMWLGRLLGKQITYYDNDYVVYKWNSVLYFFEKDEE